MRSRLPYIFCSSLLLAGWIPVAANAQAAKTEGHVAAAKALSDAGLEVSEAKPPGVSQGSRLWIEW